MMMIMGKRKVTKMKIESPWLQLCDMPGIQWTFSIPRPNRGKPFLLVSYDMPRIHLVCVCGGGGGRESMLLLYV